MSAAMAKAGMQNKCAHPCHGKLNKSNVKRAAELVKSSQTCLAVIVIRVFLAIENNARYCRLT